MYNPQDGSMDPLDVKTYRELMDSGSKGLFMVGELYEFNGARLKCTSIMDKELRFKTLSEKEWEKEKGDKLRTGLERAIKKSNQTNEHP